MVLIHTIFKLSYIFAVCLNVEWGRVGQLISVNQSEE